MDLFDVTATIEGPLRVEGEPLGARSTSYPASATLLLWSRSSLDLEALTTAPLDLDGMVRSFVVANADQVGLVTVWATRALADAGLESEAAARLGTPAVRAVFEAPVLMDSVVSERSASTSGVETP